MTIAKLSPIDVLFFRGAKAMEYLVHSLLPSPLTIYGCIGNAILNFVPAHGCSKKFRNPGDEHKILGKWNADLNLNDCTIHSMGPVWQKEDELYWPVPAHLFEAKEANPVLVGPVKSENTSHDLSSEFQQLSLLDAPPQEEEYEQASGGWVKNDSLENILCGTADKVHLEAEKNLFTREIRNGHEINPSTLTVKESMLYAIEVLDVRHRYENIHLVVWIQDTTKGTTLKELENFKTINRIGGNGYRAQIQISHDAPPIPCPVTAEDICNDSKRFLLYFATPLIFKNGKNAWLPEKEWAFEKSVGKPCQLSGAALKKYEIASGFQVGTKSSKSMDGIPRSLYRQVPAGSVYFFEAPEWELDDFKKLISEVHGKKSQSEVYPASGFGMPLVGRWPEYYR